MVVEKKCETRNNMKFSKQKGLWIGSAIMYAKRDLRRCSLIFGSLLAACDYLKGFLNK